MDAIPLAARRCTGAHGAARRARGYRLGAPLELSRRPHSAPSSAPMCEARSRRARRQARAQRAELARAVSSARRRAEL